MLFGNFRNGTLLFLRARSASPFLNPLFDGGIWCRSPCEKDLVDKMKLGKMLAGGWCRWG